MNDPIKQVLDQAGIPHEILIDVDPGKSLFSVESWNPQCLPHFSPEEFRSAVDTSDHPIRNWDDALLHYEEDKPGNETRRVTEIFVRTSADRMKVARWLAVILHVKLP